MGKILTGYIRTPAELDAAFRALERSLWQTASPQKRFLLVTEFYSHAEALPAAWLGGYVGFLAPIYIELVRLPYMRSFPPDVWVDAYNFLLLIRQQDWGERLPGLDEAITQALEQTILSHAFVSSLRELHVFLLQNGFIENVLEEREWTRVFSASTEGYGLFEAYVGILWSHSDVQLPSLARALKTWRAFRERDGAVSVILLEEETYSKYSAGRVLLMDIASHADREGDSHLNNLIGDTGRDTIEQLHRAERLTAELIASRFHSSAGNARYAYSAHESSAELVGGSLGLAVLAGLLAERTQYLNLRERWYLSSTVACMGSLEEDGTVAPGSWESIESKLRLAFHSALEKIIIPSAHREAALRAVQMLQRDYPNRMLEIIGVAHAHGLVEIDAIYSVRQRSGLERAREVVMRGNVFVVTLLVVILLGGGTYLLYHAFYDYPNLEHTRGLNVQENAIVYNPKADAAWCFRDGTKIKAPVLPFGDLEIGDGFTRTLSFWNMTPSSLHVRLSVEGADSSDWYVNSADEALHLQSASSMNFSIMYAPLTAASDKHARLVIRDADGDEPLYTLELTGASGLPLAAGYALRFDGVDDMMYFGRRSTAFDIASTSKRELTFECWFRSAEQNRNFILLHNGYAAQGETKVEDIILGMDSLHRVYYKIGSEIRTTLLPPRHRLWADRWNHIALAVSLPQKRIALYLNGEVVDDIETDFLMEGISQPDVTIGARNLAGEPDLYFKGDMDEVRVWHSFRSITEIRSTMFTTLPGATAELAGYWTMDNAVESIVFNASKRAHSGELYYRPCLVRADLPQRDLPADCAPVRAEEDGQTGVQLLAGRYLACMRPVLPRFGDASIAVRFLQTSRPAIHFYYCRTEEGWISLEEMYTFTRVGRNFISMDTGWRDAVMLVESAGRMRLFVDGHVIDTTRVVLKGPYDWHARFEGMLLGFQFDKQNQLNIGFYDFYHPALNHSRSYKGLHIWDRLLTVEEIRDWTRHEKLPRNGLTASWTLDQCPGEDRNLVDGVGGALLHVKRVQTWE